MSLAAIVVKISRFVYAEVTLTKPFLNIAPIAILEFGFILESGLATAT